jgi:SPP1 gp7 family putative phage head morphogenesis protein
MENNAYWMQRFRAIENDAHAESEVTAAEVKNIFQSAMNSIDREINSFYQKYADRNGMTLADAQQYLNNNELKAFQVDVDQYTKMAQEHLNDPMFTDLLDSLSSRAHISRLEELKIRSAMYINDAYGKTNQELSDLCAKVMQDSHLKSAFEIQKGIGEFNEFHQIDSGVIQKALSTPWTADGQTFSNRLWTHQQQLTAMLQREYTQGFIQGIDPHQMTQDIASTFGTAEYAASRLVRTECAYFAAEGDRTTYDDLGIKSFQFLVSLDERTCEECEDMDGQIIEMKDYSVGDTAPPIHANCRCTTMPVINDPVVDPSDTRIGKDADGKTTEFPGDITYKEWKERCVPDEKGPPETEPPAVHPA